MIKKTIKYSIPFTSRISFLTFTVFITPIGSSCLVTIYDNPGILAETRKHKKNWSKWETWSISSPSKLHITQAYLPVLIFVSDVSISFISVISDALVNVLTSVNAIISVFCSSMTETKKKWHHQNCIYNTIYKGIPVTGTCIKWSLPKLYTSQVSLTAQIYLQFL